jgi:hypothetical protein
LVKRLVLLVTLCQCFKILNAKKEGVNIPLIFSETTINTMIQIGQYVGHHVDRDFLLETAVFLLVGVGVDFDNFDCLLKHF